jgi:hypothetical protein
VGATERNPPHVNLTQKIAAAAGALTLGAAGIAAAGAATPDAADPGLTKASEQVGVELPASHDSHPEADGTDAADTTDTADTPDQGTGPVDNHGADVSAVAKSDATEGRAHGEAVSTVARDNHGAAADHADDTAVESDDDAADTAGDQATDTASDDAGDQSTAGAHGHS